MALQVDAPDIPSFSALFDLQGNERQGSLVLSSPLGNQLAQIEWQDGHARLLTNGQISREARSVDQLLEEATGASLPIAALFQWLGGHAMVVSGWESDLSALPNGRLVARRLQPLPQATLRVVLSD